MGHANEDKLRHLYAAFAQADLGGFLAGCTDDVTFAVPGYASVSGTYRRDEFPGWIGSVIERTAGTFQEDIVDVVANDERGVLLLVDTFERDGARHEYQTAHLIHFTDGRIARWVEHPGSMREFEEAWGRR
ncbi:MAG TPA: nuclear transport factor 2 family protein [Acidimicrobiia bacterium]